jgi:thioredoxin 1
LEEQVGTLTDVTDSTFEQEVLKSEHPVLVDFWAPWCGPCRSIHGVLAEIAEERKDSLKVVRVNVDDEQEQAFKLGVRSVPTMVDFKNGEAVDKLVGALPKRNIVERLERHLTPAKA